jgi:hypothetical protein
MAARIYITVISYIETSCNRYLNTIGGQPLNPPPGCLWKYSLCLESGSRICVQGVCELQGCGGHDVQVRRLLSVG